MGKIFSKSRKAKRAEVSEEECGDNQSSGPQSLASGESVEGFS